MRPIVGDAIIDTVQFSAIEGDAGKQRRHAFAGRADVVKRSGGLAFVIALGDDAAVVQDDDAAQIGVLVMVPLREDGVEFRIGPRLRGNGQTQAD